MRIGGPGLQLSPEELLPHGRAFRFIDEIIESDARSLTAARDVPLHEPWTDAHFPGAPIVPGVLILEGMVQTAALLVRAHIPSSSGVARGRLARVNSARFRKEVLPGARLIHRASLRGSFGGLFSFEVLTYVGSEIVAEASVVLALGELAGEDKSA